MVAHELQVEHDIDPVAARRQRGRVGKGVQCDTRHAVRLGTGLAQEMRIELHCRLAVGAGMGDWQPGADAD